MLLSHECQIKQNVTQYSLEVQAFANFTATCRGHGKNTNSGRVHAHASGGQSNGTRGRGNGFKLICQICGKQGHTTLTC